jgi:hypothetical protein
MAVTSAIAKITDLPQKISSLCYKSKLIDANIGAAGLF